ncbi:hypothetical protein B0T19DRAFT_468515 [Cercophora scortea]|uniref:Uncharacterized protein n=1 Tax=Cercophora scortea TaxID=314031 RepID=A0AAE0M5Q6_9PEZI|nr:hypothetical protein B0T19DRAFT_468515 [Cercophora scortea]
MKSITYRDDVKRVFVRPSPSDDVADDIKKTIRLNRPSLSTYPTDRIEEDFDPPPPSSYPTLRIKQAFDRPPSSKDPEEWWKNQQDANKYSDVVKRFLAARERDLTNNPISPRRGQGRVAVLNASGPLAPDETPSVVRLPNDDDPHWGSRARLNAIDGFVFETPEDLRHALVRHEGSIFARQTIVLEDMGWDWVEVLASVKNNEICAGLLTFWNVFRNVKDDTWTTLLLVDPPPTAKVVLVHGGNNCEQGGEMKVDITHRDYDETRIPPRPRLGVPRTIRVKVHSDDASAADVLDFDQWLSPIIVEKQRENEKVFWAPKEFKNPSKIPTEAPATLPDLNPKQQEPKLDSDGPPATQLKFKDRRHPIRSIFPPAPGDSSLFDELLEGVYLLEDRDPHDSCEIARTLVLARSSVIVQHLVKEALGLTVAASLGLEKFTDFDFKKLEEKPWTEQWRNDFFDHLWSLREELEYLEFELRENLDVLDMLDDYDNKNALQHIERSRRYASELLARTADAYFEAVNASGALYGNIQAVSSRKITGLATIFVPASLCAAVLAIPSFSGAGDLEKFWIFWAVSVPLAIVLALLLMTNIWAKTVEAYHYVRDAPWSQLSIEKQREARWKRAQEREDSLRRVAIRRNPIRAQEHDACQVVSRASPV